MSKEDRVVTIMERWVKGEISTDQADRELQIAGVELPKRNPGAPLPHPSLKEQ